MGIFAWVPIFCVFVVVLFPYDFINVCKKLIQRRVCVMVYIRMICRWVHKLFQHFSELHFIQEQAIREEYTNQRGFVKDSFHFKSVHWVCALLHLYVFKTRDEIRRTLIFKACSMNLRIAKFLNTLRVTQLV